MAELERIGISLDKDLLVDFDKLIRRRGYQSRSEAIRDLVRQQLSEERLADPTAQAVAAVFLVYDHHAANLASIYGHINLLRPRGEAGGNWPCIFVGWDLAVEQDEPSSEDPAVRLRLARFPEVAVRAQTRDKAQVLLTAAFLRRIAIRVSRSGGWTSVSRPHSKRLTIRSSKPERCLGWTSLVMTTCLLALCRELKVWKNSSCVCTLPDRNWMSSMSRTSTSR